MVLKLKEVEIKLTEREISLVKLYADGNRYLDIAETTKLSPRVVTSTLDGLRKRLNCKSLAQVVAIFLRNNIIK